MIGWIVESSLRFRGLVVAIAAVVVFLGITQLRDMPVDVLPEFGPPTVEVQTEALGLSAAEVEQLITVPMEQDLLNGVAWLDEIRSESIPGLSRILLIFEPGTDLFRARQVVQERLTQAHALPSVSKPPQMIQPLSSTSRVMMIGLSSKNLSADRHVGACPLDDRAPPCGRTRRGQRGRLGAAGAAAAGAGRSGAAARRRRHAPSGHRDRRERPVGVAVDLPRSVDARYRRVHRHAQSDGSGIQHISPIVTAEDLAQVRVEGTATCASATWPTVVEDHQPLIGDAVGHRGRASCSSSRSSRRRTPWT